MSPWKPPRGFGEPQGPSPRSSQDPENDRSRDEHEVLDDRRPAERPSQKHSEAAAVRELQTPEHRDGGPARVEKVRCRGNERRGAQIPSGKQPERERQLEDRDRDRDRQERARSEGLVVSEHPGESRHIEKLRDARREQDRADRETQKACAEPRRPQTLY